MSTKKVEVVVRPPRPHWVGNGFRVHGFIPSVPELSQKRMDPFLILDYNSKLTLPASEEPRGVGVHPHKGFETVTIAYKGSVAHHDSSGGGGVIHQGDVQWMTAGSGVLHKEYIEEEFNRKGGDFQMVQLWVNLRAKDKTHAPRYQTLKAGGIQKYELEDNAGQVEVVAGKYKDVEGSALTFSLVNLFNARLNSGGKADFSFPSDHTTAVLVLEGKVTVNKGRIIPTDQFVLFENEGEDFTLEAPEEEAVALILSGKPLNEPIAAYGPFVMNTQEELVQAVNDFNNGKFGDL